MERIRRQDIWYPRHGASVVTVTVKGGTGGGEYSVGVTVTVTADAPESGKHFAGWSGAEGLEFTQGSASTATIVFNMPARSVTLTATYADHSGTDDGDCTTAATCDVCGAVITPAQSEHNWGEWTSNGDGICDRCGQAIVTVKVENGAINGESGTTAVVNKDGSVTVTANAAPSGKAFKGWSVDGGKTIISESAAYTFTASENVTLTAVYEDESTGGDNTGDNTGGNTGGGNNSGGSSGGDNLGRLSGTAVIIIVIACVVVAGVGGFVLCFAIMKRKRDDK